MSKTVQIAHMFPTMHKDGRTRQEGDTSKETPRDHDQTLTTGMPRRPRIQLPRPRIKLQRTRIRIPRAIRECRPRSQIQEMLPWSQNQNHLNGQHQVQKKVPSHPSDRKRNGLNPTTNGFRRLNLPNQLTILIFLCILVVINRTCHGREYHEKMTKVDPVSKWTGFQRPTDPALCWSSYGGISSDFSLLVVCVICGKGRKEGITHGVST